MLAISMLKSARVSAHARAVALEGEARLLCLRRALARHVPASTVVAHGALDGRGALRREVALLATATHAEGMQSSVLGEGLGWEAGRWACTSESTWRPRRPSPRGIRARDGPRRRRCSTRPASWARGSRARDGRSSSSCSIASAALRRRSARPRTSVSWRGRTGRSESWPRSPARERIAARQR